MPTLLASPRFGERSWVGEKLRTSIAAIRGNQRHVKSQNHCPAAYSFARVSALVGMNMDDYYPDGKRWWFRLHEKGGRFHELPCHHIAEEYIDAYLAILPVSTNRRLPLFRSLDRRRQLTDRRLDRREVLAMIKRRALAAAVPSHICCHTFRATGITAYLLNGGTLEHAQQIAAHSSPKTTKLYDRTSDSITLDEIERILI